MKQTETTKSIQPIRCNSVCNCWTIDVSDEYLLVNNNIIITYIRRRALLFPYERALHAVCVSRDRLRCGKTLSRERETTSRPSSGEC